MQKEEFEARLRRAKEFFELSLFQECLQELDTLLKEDPFNDEAMKLQEQAQAQFHLVSPDAIDETNNLEFSDFSFDDAEVSMVDDSSADDEFKATLRLDSLDPDADFQKEDELSEDFFDDGDLKDSFAESSDDLGLNLDDSDIDANDFTFSMENDVLAADLEEDDPFADISQEDLNEEDFIADDADDIDLDVSDSTFEDDVDIDFDLAPTTEIDLSDAQEAASDHDWFIDEHQVDSDHMESQSSHEQAQKEENSVDFFEEDHEDEVLVDKGGAVTEMEFPGSSVDATIKLDASARDAPEMFEIDGEEEDFFSTMDDDASDLSGEEFDTDGMKEEASKPATDDQTLNQAMKDFDFDEDDEIP